MEEKISATKYVEVTNRNNGITGYTLSNGLERTFNLRETKKIPLEELQEVEAIPGGEYLLRNYLMIKDQTALEYLNINPEPEYFYTEDEIQELLNNGTIEQLEDCLNFAPQGVIDLVKSFAVKLEIPDIRKRDLITKKTGFNISNAIMVNKALEEEPTPAVEATTTQRKAEPVKAATSARKAAPVTTKSTPSYKVVTPKE